MGEIDKGEIGKSVWSVYADKGRSNEVEKAVRHVDNLVGKGKDPNVTNRGIRTHGNLKLGHAVRQSAS